MKALVTGAGGFIASYLLPYLQSQNIEVEVLSSKRLGPLRCHTDNWKDPDALANLLERIKPDYIFHLAGTRDISHLSEFIQVNILYASNLFEAMVKSRVLVPILVVGSAAEYGRAGESQIPLTEETPTQPVSEYAVSKNMQTMISLLAFQMGIPAVIGRVFNLIGPGMPSRLVMGKFVEQLAQAMRGTRDSIEMGNTTALRDFIDVYDVVDIFWKLIREPKASGRVVNICSGKATSVSELLTRLQSFAGTCFEVKSAPALPSGLDFSCGSNARLIQLIGDFRFRTLDESLQMIARNLQSDLIGHKGSG